MLNPPVSGAPLRALAALALLAASAAAQIPNAYPIFDQDAVHEIKLTFPNADWYDVLVANYDGVRADNPYFTAALEWGPYKFDSVGVRFKGNSSYSGSATTRKRPFRIKLNEFVKGQKIDGLGSFSLGNALGDASFVREKVYYELAAKLGIKAPRSNFAALYINGEYWGLYTMTEVVNSDFLKNYFGKSEDTGNLYKGNIGATFAYLGEDAAAYKTAWEKQSNEDADDWTDLIALTKLINDTPAAELKSKLEPLMDLDSFLASMALDNATVNLDNYVGMSQNFNIYRRPSDGRWVWIPWDPSLAFGSFSGAGAGTSTTELPLEYLGTGNAGGGGQAPGGQFPGGGQQPPAGGQQPPAGGGQFPGGGQGGQAPGGGAGQGAQNQGRPLLSKLWDAPEYKERYRQIYQQLIEKVFLPDQTLARMEALRTLIRPWVEKDTKKLVTQTAFDNAMTTSATSGQAQPGGQGQQGGGGLQGGGPALQPLVEGRTAWIKTQLAASPQPTFRLNAGVTSLSLTQKVGGTAPTEAVQVTTDGANVTANFAVYGSTATGGSWLSISPAGSAAPGEFKVTVGTKLTAGTYTGEVRIYSTGAANSPLLLPVTLTVTE